MPTKLDCDLTHTEFCAKYRIPKSVRHLLTIGHGHVRKLPDGSSKTCGGIEHCKECSDEFVKIIPGIILSKSNVDNATGRSESVESFLTGMNLPKLSWLSEFTKSMFSFGRSVERFSQPTVIDFPEVDVEEPLVDILVEDLEKDIKRLRKSFKLLKRVVKDEHD